MFDPTTGRWLQEDPLHVSAGDTNLYRFVTNDTTNATDPDGLQKRPIRYSKPSGLIDRFHIGGGSRAGYSSRILIGYDTASTTRPKNGWFIQVNYLSKIVIFEDDTLFIENKIVFDYQQLDGGKYHSPKGQNYYDDTMEGPDFPINRGNVVAAFMNVEKIAGFADATFVPDGAGKINLDGSFSVYSEADAKTSQLAEKLETDVMDSDYATGNLTYGYLYLNPSSFRKSKAFRNAGSICNGLGNLPESQSKKLHGASVAAFFGLLNAVEQLEDRYTPNKLYASNSVYHMLYSPDRHDVFRQTAFGGTTHKIIHEVPQR